MSGYNEDERRKYMVNQLTHQMLCLLEGKLVPHVKNTRHVVIGRLTLDRTMMAIIATLELHFKAYHIEVKVTTKTLLEF